MSVVGWVETLVWNTNRCFFTNPSLVSRPSFLALPCSYSAPSEVYQDLLSSQLALYREVNIRYMIGVRWLRFLAEEKLGRLNESRGRLCFYKNSSNDDSDRNHVGWRFHGSVKEICIWRLSAASRPIHIGRVLLRRTKKKSGTTKLQIYNN